VLAIGGFAHSRIREVLLGGVTRALVRENRVPLLLAH
jgi:nucleotide-binding universal stress UspA family protein